MTDENLIFSPESELAVLGAMMAHPDAAAAAYDRLSASQFGDPFHRALFEAVTRVRRSGKMPAPALVRDALPDKTSFEAWGGIGILIDLFTEASVMGLDDHLDAVTDRYVRRELVGLSAELRVAAVDVAGESAETLVSRLERDAAAIAKGTTTKDAWMSIGDAMGGALVRARERRGRIIYPFGIKQVDEATGGMAAGETTVLAAWTGMGKTLAGLQVAKANATAGLGVCLFSLEMSLDAVAMRLACDVAFRRNAVEHSGLTTNITIDKALKGDLTDAQWRQLEEAQEEVARWPLMIDAEPGLTMVQIEARARRQHRRWERQGIAPGPILVDHIGKVRAGTDRRGDRTSEMADISADCSNMAKRLGVPVMPMAQLNRGVEQGAEHDRRPQLSHIKQSSAIAEDARQVIFLYRPEYYYERPAMEHEDTAKRDERESKLQAVRRQFYWIIEKQSNGPRTQVLSFCDARCSALREWV